MWQWLSQYIGSVIIFVNIGSPPFVSSSPLSHKVVRNRVGLLLKHRVGAYLYWLIHIGCLHRWMRGSHIGSPSSGAWTLVLKCIQCNCPAFIYGDNQSVLANTTIPHLMLKKKSNSIAYHFVREGTACDEWRDTYINTNDNQSSLLTNPFPHGENRTKFYNMLLHHIWVWIATRKY